MRAAFSTMRNMIGQVPVMPILTIDDPNDAADLAAALVDGGLPILEVLMRTPGARKAIEAIASACPDAVVGAGTLISEDQIVSARDAGASFGVSPGLTEGVASAARRNGLPLLPGVSTPAEAMFALEHGYTEQKYFPAHGAAGVGMLKMMAPVFPQILFCPTGGITLGDLSSFLSLPNCGIVGGSWVAPVTLIRERDWKAITRLAREAVEAAGRR